MSDDSCKTAARPRREGRAVGALIVAGFLAGLVSKLADRWYPPLGDLTSHLGPWVVFVVLIARSAPSRASASVRAAFFFVAMTIAYYGTAALVFGKTAKVFLTFWLLASVSGAPLAAAVTHGSGRQDWGDSLSRAFPIGLLAAEALRLSFKPGPTDWFALFFDVGAAGFLLAVWTRKARSRSQFAVLLVGTTCTGFALARAVGLGFHLLKV